MSNLDLSLTQSEVKIILEALIEKEASLSAVCEGSDDEDEIADTGNDLIELRLLLNPLKERAIDKYGSGVMNFSTSPL